MTIFITAETTRADQSAAARIVAIQHDIEDGHREADEILCEILAKLGYEKTVAAFRKMRKWYA